MSLPTKETDTMSFAAKEMLRGIKKVQADTTFLSQKTLEPVRKDIVGARVYKLREGFEFSCPKSQGIAKITRTGDDLYLNCSDESCGITKLDEDGLKSISSDKATYQVDLTKKLNTEQPHAK